jgi:hypothetical protein
MQRLQRKKRRYDLPREEAVRQRVADEGNQPGEPSFKAIAFIFMLLLVGLGLMYLGASYGPSHA